MIESHSFVSITRTISLGFHQLLQGSDLFRSVHLIGDFFESELGVQELRIDGVRSLEALTHDENFGRLGTGGLGLGDFYLVEQLLQYEQKRIVVLRSEHLGNESTTSSENFSGQLKGLK